MVNLVQKEYNKKFIAYTREGIKKYHGRFSDTFLPPTSTKVPQILINNKEINKRTVAFFWGFIKVHEGSPEYRIILKEAKKFKRKISILDIGCADCAIAEYLLGFGVNIDYEGVDISRIESKYKIYPSMNKVPYKKYDLIIMTHLAEHLRYNIYLEQFQNKIVKLLAKDGVYIFATPNPISLKHTNNDITHIQIYPWHQTYALLRFGFDSVDVIRCVHLMKLTDIIFLPLRIFLAKMVYVDYAANILYVCR